MKANKAFKTSDDAVSPVIGVILMVAITVVLAAVVFVLVSDLGEGGESAPQISFTKSSSSAGTVYTVTKITNGPVLFGDLLITPGACDWTAPATSVAGDAISAGNAITCTGTGSLTIVHEPTDTLIFQQSF